MSGTFRKKEKKERNRQKWEKTLHLIPHLRGFKVKLTKQANLQWSIYLSTGWFGATKVWKRRQERELNRVMEEEEERVWRGHEGRENEHWITNLIFFKTVGIIRVDANKPRSSPKHEIGITQPLWRNCGSAPEWKFLQKKPPKEPVISSLAAFLTQSQSPHLNFSLRWPLSDSSWLYKYIYVQRNPFISESRGITETLWDKKQLRYCKVSAGWFYKGCLSEEAGVSRKTLETFINISEPWSSENWSLIKASWDTVQLPICMAMYFFPSPKLRPFPF